MWTSSPFHMNESELVIPGVGLSHSMGKLVEYQQEYRNKETDVERRGHLHAYRLITCCGTRLSLSSSELRTLVRGTLGSGTMSKELQS
jgi:hypothetical protein